jgi:ligand-binding SRPBCC domain-containing protein
MIYQLHREQQLNCDIDTAWKFFSNPYNLSRITPEDMGFVVLSQIKDEPIYEGMIIEYKVSPLFGIPMKWKSRITQVEYHKSFTDFQEAGPYKLWNHHHEFISNQSGVLMKDRLDYELPLGFIGTIVHALLIKNKLNKIFGYRYKVLEKMFNKEN